MNGAAAVEDFDRRGERLFVEEGCRALALGFIAGTAAPSPVLASFGRGFADFLGAHPVLEDVPYLADVARLERMVTEAHLAADQEDAGTYERDLTSQVAWFATPAVTIWQAHRQPNGFRELTPEWVPECALVRRAGGAVIVERIEQQEEGHGN